VHEKRTAKNDDDMKKTSSEDLDDDLRPHYDFDFKKMKPNRFARMDFEFEDGTRRVLLDADVAATFGSSESVNEVLRSVIRAMRTAGSKAKSPAKTAKRRAS
jgi:hypothetical protein